MNTVDRSQILRFLRHMPVGAIYMTILLGPICVFGITLGASQPAAILSSLAFLGMIIYYWCQYANDHDRAETTLSTVCRKYGEDVVCRDFGSAQHLCSKLYLGEQFLYSRQGCCIIPYDEIVSVHMLEGDADSIDEMCCVTIRQESLVILDSCDPYFYRKIIHAIENRNPNFHAKRQHA